MFSHGHCYKHCRLFNQERIIWRFFSDEKSRLGGLYFRGCLLPFKGIIGLEMIIRGYTFGE